MKKITLLTIILALLTATFSWAEKSQPAKSKQSSHAIQVHVKGMVCDFCARGLEKVFSKKKEVSTISVDLDKGLVTVNMNKNKNLSDKELTKLIKGNGYTIEKIERGEAVKITTEKKPS